MVPITNNNYDQRLLEGESQTLKFKTSFDKTTVESLVAFANAQSGRALLTFTQSGGVNGGVKEGVKEAPDNLIRQKLEHFTHVSLTSPIEDVVPILPWNIAEIKSRGIAE